MSSQPYGFDDDIEPVIALHACTVPKFWGTCAKYIEADRMANPAVELCLQAIAAIAHDTGNGPSSVGIVIQRLKRWVVDGKIKLKELRAVRNMLLAVYEINDIPDAIQLSAEISPILKQEKLRDAANIAADAYAGSAEIEAVEKALNTAKRIGQVDGSIGALIGEDMVDFVVASARTKRLPLYIHEVDQYLGGGAAPGVSMAIGLDKGGKSMFLNHIYTGNVLHGAFALYASCENPMDEAQARFLAASTDVPTNDIPSNADEVRRRIKKLLPSMGRGVIKAFAPGTATVEDIIEWMISCEAQVGRQCDLLVIDYLDKLDLGVSRNVTTYEAAGKAMDKLHALFEERKSVCWTVSQAIRGKGRNRLDNDDISDSKHKIRSATLVMTLNRVDDPGSGRPSIEYFISASRKGKSRDAVGPIEVDWSRARQTVEPLVYVDWNAK